MLKVVGQDIISGAMGFIGTDSDRLYRMGAAEKTEDVTVTGNPAVLDNATGKPFRDLYIYGRSTQDGTPTPDAPVPIVNAGDGGSVAVKVTGRNILDMRNSRESVNGEGITYTRSADYSFTRTGTATGTTGNVWIAGGYEQRPAPDLSNVFCILLKGVQYSIKDCLLFAVTPISKHLTAQGDNFVPPVDMYITGVRNEKFILDKTYNDIVYPAVYVEAKALPYEPYREQLLTMPTPNGLSGIPVASGGNYTDQSGQRWVCDEVDLARGVKVQRVKVKELSPDDQWTYQKLANGNNNFQTHIINNEEIAGKALPSICSILPFKNVIWNDNIQNLPKIYVYEKEITASFPPSSEYSSLEVFKQLLTDVKSVIYYVLAAPIETPLTTAEIAAYKSLRTYRGTTIVEARDKAGISATYKCNTKAAEKEVNILHADLMAEMEELDENSEIV